MKVHWGHSHGQGWQPQEAFRFADSIVKNGPAMTTCVTEPKGRNISFTIKPASDATKVTAQIIYINEKLSYSSKTPGSWETIDQSWKAQGCTVEGQHREGHPAQPGEELLRRADHHHAKWQVYHDHPVRGGSPLRLSNCTL